MAAPLHISKRPLKDYPEKERALWRIFDRVPFESGVAAERLDDDAVLSTLDYPAYFELLELPLPEGRAAILDALRRDDLIISSEAGGSSTGGGIAPRPCVSISEARATLVASRGC